MQTFLPYADYAKSAAVLDDARLGNQCYRESVTLYRILEEKRTGGWANHPACKMWRGHEHHLALYGLATAREMRGRWVSQGWLRPKWKPEVVDRWCSFWAQKALSWDNHQPPPWLGDAALHRSHRSNLLRKVESHYRQYWPDERSDLPYIWPTGGER